MIVRALKNLVSNSKYENMDVVLFGTFCAILDFILSGKFWSNVAEAMLMAFFCAVSAAGGKELWKMLFHWYLNERKKTHKMNNVFFKFLQETLARLFQKSPVFFKIWQMVFGASMALAGIPYLLKQFNLNLPEPFNTMSNKVIAFAAAVGWLMSRLTVKDTTVAQTKAGEAVKATDKELLPFTAYEESKEIEKKQPPVINPK